MINFTTGITTLLIFPFAWRSFRYYGIKKLIKNTKKADEAMELVLKRQNNQAASLMEFSVPKSIMSSLVIPRCLLWVTLHFYTKTIYIYYYMYIVLVWYIGTKFVYEWSEKKLYVKTFLIYFMYAKLLLK